MPRYEPNEDDMMDSSYGKVEPPEDKPEAPSESVDEENAGASEILIEKNKLPAGCKVGDTYEFKVTKDFGDEASLMLSQKSEDTTNESVESGELAALSEEGE